MNYTLMPSLERTALIKTAITLWNPDAHLYDNVGEDFEWITEDHVIGKVKELPLPESLKKKISGFIKPIGFEILKWLKCYKIILSNSGIEFRSISKESSVDVYKEVGKSLSKLCWTPQGKVDRKKTAEELIRDENLDIKERYKLACIFCLRNDVLKLWNKMPECCRKSFYSEEDPGDVKQDLLVVFWTYDIKGEPTRMNDLLNVRKWKRLRCTPYGYAFLYAATFRWIEATEYFWRNLTPEEREELLIRSLRLICNVEIDPGEDDEDVLFFVLSLMNEQQQSIALNLYSWYILPSLLDWPWQDFFMETANRAFTFLSEEEYIDLFERIVYFVKCGYKDYDYKKLLREFWHIIPITLKENVLDEFARDLLLYLFEIEEKEYFKIIFAFPKSKKLLSNKEKCLCVSLIFNDKMDLLEVFVQECISFKDIIIKFREEFENFIIHHHSNIKKTQQEKTAELSKFFLLLDQLLLENGKRKHVDEGNTDPAAKRLCVLKHIFKYAHSHLYNG